MTRTTGGTPSLAASLFYLDQAIVYTEREHKAIQAEIQAGLENEDEDGDQGDDDDEEDAAVRTFYKKFLRNSLTSRSLNPTILDFCFSTPSQQSDGCRVCGTSEDEAHTLICDECEQSYHMYCLRPKLREVPAGDWFCPECRQAQALRKKTQPKGTSAAKQTRATAATAAATKGGKKAEPAPAAAGRVTRGRKRIEESDEG